jgi:nitrogen fixation protein
MKEKVYKKIDVEIRGLTPLLMNRLNPDSLKAKSRMRTENYSTETDAKNSAYMAEISGKQQLYIPQECLYSMIIGTAKQYRHKRIGVSSLLAGTMRVEPEKVSLGTDKYEVDERAVVIQNQRVLKGRAKIPKGWKAKFQLVYDAKRLPTGIETTLYQILDDAGTRMGILDYRPQHRGWFGTFAVEKFVLEDGRDLVAEDSASEPSD